MIHALSSLDEYAIIETIEPRERTREKGIRDTRRNTQIKRNGVSHLK